MRQLEFIGPHNLRWVDAPDPHLLSTSDALVEPLVVTTCTLDKAIIGGLTPFRPPFPIGHEVVGKVLEVGADVSSVSPGETVVVPFQVSCGTCEPCSLDLSAHCASVPRESMYGTGEISGSWGGALADILRVPFADHLLVKAPSDIPLPVLAAASDNIADGILAVSSGLLRYPNAEVLIAAESALTAVAMYAAEAAHALGASRVTVASTSDSVAQRIAALGGDSLVVGESWPRRLEPHRITVDATNDPTGLACVIRSTKNEGQCTSVSMYFENEVPIPMLEMYSKGITLRAARVNARASLDGVLDLLAQGTIDGEVAITDHCSWMDAPTSLLDYDVKLAIHRDRATLPGLSTEQ